jgi:hypothetical protein
MKMKKRNSIAETLVSRLLCVDLEAHSRRLHQGPYLSLCYKAREA